MRIRSQAELSKFDDVLNHLSGSAILENTRTGETFDLTDKAERKAVYPLLLNDYRESMELFVTKREDTETMMGFLNWLAGNQNGLPCHSWQ